MKKYRLTISEIIRLIYAFKKEDDSIAIYDEEKFIENWIKENTDNNLPIDFSDTSKLLDQIKDQLEIDDYINENQKETESPTAKEDLAELNKLKNK